MPGLLKNAFNDIENLKGKKLVLTIIIVFFTFLFIGILIGYLRTPTLNQNETNMVVKKGGAVKPEFVSYSGLVEYRNPDFYPEDEVSYVLVDTSGEDVILLKADDNKLEIVEGLFVKVSGRKVRSSNNKDVLIVEEVEISNVSD